MRITGRNRYLVRKALAYAIPLLARLDETAEDGEDMGRLLHALDADSFRLNHESVMWQIGADGYLRHVDPEPPRPVSPPRDRLKVVPIKPQGDRPAT
jgi:hypothetical protein